MYCPFIKDECREPPEKAPQEKCVFRRKNGFRDCEIFKALHDFVSIGDEAENTSDPVHPKN